MEFTFTINLLGWPIGLILMILSLILVLMWYEQGAFSKLFSNWFFYISSGVVFVLTFLWTAVRVYRGG